MRLTTETYKTLVPMRNRSNDDFRSGIEHIFDASQTIITLLENNRPVFAQELEGITAKAANLGLLSMQKLDQPGLCPADDNGMLLARYVHEKAARALDTLNAVNGRKKLTETYKAAAADIRNEGCIGKAHKHRAGVNHIFNASEVIITLLENNRPVLVQEVTGIITRAEDLGLVSREGMRQSGLHFVMNEEKIQKKTILLPEEGMAVVRHLHREAARALNILDNPNGYTPRAREPIYGGRHNGWTPLIP